MNAHQRAHTPSKQPFNKELASLCGQSTSHNLNRRKADYKRMIDSARNPDDYSGYHCPGSLKK